MNDAGKDLGQLASWDKQLLELPACTELLHISIRQLLTRYSEFYKCSITVNAGTSKCGRISFCLGPSNEPIIRSLSRLD